jgi:hypothetical protein
MTAMLNPTDRVELDIAFYRSTNPDVGGFSDEQIIHHYNSTGFFEGRASSKFCFREIFIEELKFHVALEIGPFTNPCLVGPTVFYCDVLDKEALIERAIAHNIPHNSTPDIDYLMADCSLKSIKKNV